MADKKQKLEVVPPAEEPEEMPLPSDPKVIFLGGLFALALLAAVYVAAEIVLPLVLAVVLKLLLQPAMRLLERWHVPRMLAALLLILAVFGTIVGLGAAIAGPASTWAAKLPEGIPRLQERLSFLEAPINTLQRFLQQVEDYGQPAGAPAAVSAGSSRLMTQLFTGTRDFAPRRNANGVDIRRVAHVLAVLEKRCHFNLGQHDVFIHVPGGLKAFEPATDLAMALAVASSFRDVPVDPDVVCFGEVGLTGEVRTVSHADRRLAEITRQGFTACLLPPGKAPGKKTGVKCIHLHSLEQAFAEGLGE
jgi:hypothetical protein